MNDAANFWTGLNPKYRLILCDLWGVVHDGYRLFPGVVERLRGWREEGRFVLLISNAPRTSAAVEGHLERLGLPRDAWDRLVTGGEAGIDALQALGEPVGFVGTADDRRILEGRGVLIADRSSFTDLACTGVEECRTEVADYVDDLKRWTDQGVRMHCLNPDRLVIHGGKPVVCAGALADAYEQIGGKVIWYGKPYPAIYRHALHLAGDPPRECVLAVGDGLQTDMVGAARMGFDAVYVTGGIAEGAPFPQDFAVRHGLGDWQPVAVVPSLA